MELSYYIMGFGVLRVGMKGQFLSVFTQVSWVWCGWMVGRVVGRDDGSPCSWEIS